MAAADELRLYTTKTTYLLFLHGPLLVSAGFSVINLLHIFCDILRK